MKRAQEPEQEDSQYSEEIQQNQESSFKINDYGRQDDIKTSKRFWTQREDQKLIELVGKYGQVRWTEISMELPGRSAKRCRERWMNYLDTTKNHSNFWTFHQKWVLFLCFKVYGNKWSIISKLIKRGDNIIKNQVNCLKRKKMVPFQSKLKETLKTQNFQSVLEDPTQLELQMLNILASRQKPQKVEAIVPKMQPVITIKPIQEHGSSFNVYNPQHFTPYFAQHYPLAPEFYNPVMNFHRPQLPYGFYYPYPFYF